jgi:hypothetical protein
MMPVRLLLIVATAFALTGCSGGGQLFSTDAFRRGDGAAQEVRAQRIRETGRNESIWDLFTNVDEPNTTLEVNRYLWVASLQVLDFLPVETVDPFTGVIVTGFGTPPGGGRPYRATVHITDGALDARSLNVALVSRGGPVAANTQRAVEDAILARARQLRIQDRRL